MEERGKSAVAVAISTTATLWQLINMAFHFDPVYSLAWLDQPGASVPDSDTLWRFPLPADKHDPAIPAIALEAVERVMLKRPWLTAMQEAGEYVRLREFLTPVIHTAISSVTAPRLTPVTGDA